MKYNERGEELPDDTPVEVPLKFRRPVNDMYELEQMMRRLQEEQRRQGEESFAESLDFDEDEEYDISALPSRYELDDEVEERALTYAENAERIRLQSIEAAKREKANVQQGGVGGDRAGAAGNGKVDEASGGKGRSAGNGEGGVSERAGQDRGSSA